MGEKREERKEKREGERGERRGMRGMLGRMPLLCADTAVLRGTVGASVYGCRRILRYSPTRICLLCGARRLSVCGKGLLCVSLCGGCVTVTGEVEGLLYCTGDCASCKEET